MMSILKRKLVVILSSAAFLLLASGSSDLTYVCAKDKSLPDLKRMEPKLHKVEPYKAGIEHNQVLEKQKKKEKKVKRKKLKSKADKSRFKGRSSKADLDKRKNLKSEASTTALDSAAERGVGIIGVKFVAYQGLPPVINVVFPGTPAAEAGLKPNDAIVAVDGVPTYGLLKEECYDLIVGSPNTPVTLSIRRGNSFSVYTMMRMDHLELKDPRIKRAYGIQL